MLLFTLEHIRDDEQETVGYLVHVHTDNGTDDTFSSWPYQADEFRKFANKKGLAMELYEENKLVSGESFWGIHCTAQSFCLANNYPYRILEI